MVLQICKYANNMNSRLADFYETFANIATLYMVSVLSCSSLSVSDLDMHIQVCTSKSRRNVIMQNPDLCGITPEVREFIRDNCAMDTPDGEERKGKRLASATLEQYPLRLGCAPPACLCCCAAPSDSLARSLPKSIKV